MAVAALVGLLTAWLACPCRATSYDLNRKPHTEPSRYQRPEDLLDLVPLIGDLPRSFLLGNGYRMKLIADSLRIDHMGYRSSTAPHARDCMIGLSYTTPVMGFFTSSVDLPLVFASTPRPADWTFSGIGDYTAHFSRGAAESATVRIVLTAKF